MKWIFIIGVLCCGGSYAQEISHNATVIGAQNQLRPFDIQDMVRDADGYLWIISQSAAQRFDGHRAISYYFNETLTDVYADKQGRVWVVGRQNLYRFIPSRNSFSMLFSDSTANGFIHFYEPREDSLYLIHRKGCYTYIAAADSFVTGEKPGRLPPVQYRQWLGAWKEIFFVRTNDSIYRYNSQTAQLQGIPFRRHYTSIVTSPDELLVSAINYRSYRIDWKALAIKPIENELPFQQEYNGFVVFHAGVPYDSLGAYLISSNKRLLVYQPQKKMFAPIKIWSKGLLFDDSSPPQSLYRDAEGNILMGHASGLVLLSAKGAGIRYRQNGWGSDQQFPSSDIRGFSEDENGSIWMATTGGVCRLNPADGNIFHLPLATANDDDIFPSFRQVLYTKKRLWIGTSGSGVLLRQSGTFTEEALQYPQGAWGNAMREKLAKAYVWKILPYNERWMLVATGSDFFVVNRNSLMVQPLPLVSAHWSTRSLMVDDKGLIWHGTVLGLTISDSSGKLKASFQQQFPDKRIAAITPWQNKQVYVGTKGLFVVSKTDTGYQLSNVPEFPKERFVYCITADRQGLLWLGTDEGIFSYNPVNKAVNHYDYNDNVQPQAFNSDGAFCATNGTVYMGGHNGLNFFDPKMVAHRTQPLMPRIEQLVAGDQVFSADALHEPPDFAYNNNNLVLTLGAPSMQNPAGILFRYKLREDETSWVNVGTNRELRLASLSPGNYAIQLAASYPGGLWYAMEKPVMFTIKKPWWLSNTFRLIVLALLLAAGMALVLRRQRKRRAIALAKAIHWLSEKHSHHESVHHLMTDIVQTCIRVLDLEDCVVYKWDEDKQLLLQTTALANKLKEDGSIKQPIVLALGVGIVGAAAASQKTICVSDTRTDSRYIVDDAMRLSELAVPIVNDGRLLGVIDAEHSQRGFFIAWRKMAVEAIAAACAGKLAAMMATEQLQVAERAVIQLQADMNEARLMNLRLQMNPHFLFNILNSVQYLIISGQTDKAISYLNIFSKFLRAILEHATDNIVTLQEELRILKMYLDLESLVTDETFHHSMKLEEAIEPEETLVPFMLLQPFVENAIHHGLLHRLGHKQIDIGISSINEQQWCISIEDNGIGLKASTAINEKKWKSKPHHSLGTDIVRQRLKLLERTTGIASGLTISDKSNGEGVRVEILLPVLNEEDL